MPSFLAILSAKQSKVTKKKSKHKFNLSKLKQTNISKNKYGGSKCRPSRMRNIR